MKLHYQKHLKPFSQQQRKAGNLAEVLLWNELKGNKLGYRFLRQRPIGKYIVDFYCHELNIAIEIDGAASHDSKVEKDEVRQKELEATVVRVVRVTDADVRYTLSGVVEMIKTKIPPPRRRGYSL
jgi:very-short-patch-repair endonuclease